MSSKTPVLKYEEYRGKPIEFANDVLGLDLHQRQKRWLRETLVYGKDKRRYRNILVPGNQFGKTLVSAVKIIYLCYFKYPLEGEIEKINYPILLCSPVSRQARQGFTYVQQIINGELTWQKPSGEWVANDCKIQDFMVKSQEMPRMEVHFKNELGESTLHVATIGASKGRSLQGNQYAWIIYDEAPQSYHLAEELPARLMSRLIKFGGGIDLIGTPEMSSPSLQYYMHIVKKGLKRNKHGKIAGEEGWWALTGELDDNRFISKLNRNRLKKNIKQTSPEMYRQVVFGEFVKGMSTLFTPEQIEACFDTALEFTRSIGLHEYVTCVDWAMSQDYTVMMTWDITKKGHATLVNYHRFRGNEKSPQEQYALLRDLVAEYGADIVMDGAALGGTIIKQDLQDLNPIALSLTARTGSDSKPGVILALKKCLNKKCIHMPRIEEVAEELGSYKLDDKKIRQDTVMTLAYLAWWMEEKPVATDPISFDFTA